MKKYCYSILAIFIAIIFTGCMADYQLQNSMARNDINAFKMTLQKNPELLKQVHGRSGLNTLQYSLVNGSYDIANYLVDKNLIDINNKGYYGFNSGYFVAGGRAQPGENVDINMAKKLLSKGLNVKSDFDSYSNNMLHMMCKHKEFGYISEPVLKLYLKAGLDVNHLNKGNATPLYNCMFNANDKVAKFLIDNGADSNLGLNILKVAMDEPYKHGKFINNNFFDDTDYKNVIFLAANYMNKSKLGVKNNNDETILHFIAKYNTNHELVKKYLAGGHDINAKNKEGLTPLQVAMNRDGNVKTVLTLIENGANINEKVNGLTVASYLVANSRYYKDNNKAVSAVLNLIKKGSTILDSHLGTLLQMVSLTNSKKNIDFIIKKLPYTEETLSDGLNMSLINKEIKDSTILYLIEKGAKSSVNSDGLNTLSIAIASRDVEITKALVNKGLNVNIQDNKGFTPILYSVVFGDVEHTKYLISKGADYKLTDAWGNNLIHASVYFNKPEQLDLLAKKGLNVNSKNNEGESIFHVMYKSTRTYRFPNIADLVKTELDNILIESGVKKALVHHKKIIDTLIKNGANINAQNNLGETATHYFLKKYYDQSNNKNIVKTMEYLISKGLDINKPNKFGLLPWYYQSREEIKYDDLQKLLITKGVKRNNLPKNQITSLNITSDGRFQWNNNETANILYTTAPNGQVIEKVEIKKESNSRIKYATYSRYNELGKLVFKYIGNNWNYRYRYIVFDDYGKEILNMKTILSHHYRDRYKVHLGFGLTENGYVASLPIVVAKKDNNGEMIGYSIHRDYNPKMKTTLTFNGSPLYKDKDGRWEDKAVDGLNTLNDYLDEPISLNEVKKRGTLPYKYTIRQVVFTSEGVLGEFDKSDYDTKTPLEWESDVAMGIVL